MKKLSQFIFVYLILIGLIFTLFINTNSRELKQLNLTQSELAGVDYLKGIHKLSISLSLYKESLEINEDKEAQDILKRDMIKDIKNIYHLLKEHPQFANKELQDRLELLSNIQFADDEYYEFLDYLNHENYRVGDTSQLLFEEDRKLYFLGTLITHYLPEYLISLIIVHNKIEEFAHNNTFSDTQKKLFTEQNKLIKLSLNELDGIISLLKPYPETAKLASLISNIKVTRDKLKLYTYSLNNWEKDEKELENYLFTTYQVLSLSFELNDESTRLLETALLNRIKTLEDKIVYQQLGLGFLLFLITSLSYYFYQSYQSNLKKDEEIKKINKTLDKAVIYSRTDKSGRITHVSTALLELSGYSKGELIGQNHNIFRHPDMKKEVFADLWNTISKKQTWEGEIKNIRKDSSSYWAKVIITVDCDDKGKILGYDAYRENITDKKELELEKQKTQEALDFKSMFLSNMSHEIRTPLGGVIGLTHLVLKTDLNENQKDLLTKIESSSHILLGVINDILDISKIESGKMPIEKSPFDLKETIHNITDILSSKVETQGIHLNVDYINLSNFNFIGDSLRISQVLTNLLSNAIKFTSKGSVNLGIKQLDKQLIQFEIKDTGIGLKEEDIQGLFKEFQQADMSTSRKYGGTGLGLAITKNLVELMGGKVWVESEYGVGSTFAFQIPLEVSLHQEETEDELEHDIDALKEQLANIEEVSILVAEDNKMNQLIIEMALEDTKIKTDFALDGKIALEMFKQNNYALILMDIQMPNMNGYQSTEAIRKIDSDIPIIALSANVMQEDVEKSLYMGMNKHLAKPIEFKKLYSTLLYYLRDKKT